MVQKMRSIENLGFLVFTLSMFICSVSISLGAEINVPGDQPTIQDGINAAVSGDMVLVQDGTYEENVIVDKALIIRSENGYASTSVRAFNSSEHAFKVTSANVTIDGFTVHGVAIDGKAGIYLGSGINDCTIVNNCCGTDTLSNVYGIYLFETNSNTIEDNICDGNSDYGIVLMHSGNNSLSGNSCKLNDKNGIYLWDSNNNTLTNNTCNENNRHAICLAGDSHDNTISGNTITGNSYGIRIDDSNYNHVSNNYCSDSANHAIMVDNSGAYNIISGNTCEDNTSGSGVQLWDASSNKVMNNICSRNSNGIALQTANENKISANTCTENDDTGILLSSSSQDNSICGNKILSENERGIHISYSSSNIISNNACSLNSKYGISLVQSPNNTLLRNSSYNNDEYGIFLLNSSNNNTLYLNSFVDNSSNVFSMNSVNFWNSPDAINYYYQGILYSSFLGNYYSNHILTDSDGDGIADHSENLPNNEPDGNYPLAMADNNYILKIGDLDYDNDADGSDMANFAKEYQDEDIRADLNQDGSVDTLDLQLFAANFGA